MRCTSLQKSGHKPIDDRTIVKSTAYYLMHEREKVSYKIDGAHFRAKNKMFNVPVVSSGGEDLDRLANEMVSTADTVMTIVDLFIDGARIAFHKPEDAAMVYKRITAHIDRHLEAMRTDPTYTPPPVEDLRNLTEFAIMIRKTAFDGDNYIETVNPNNSFSNFLPVRASFSYDGVSEAKRELRSVPKVSRKMDAIERYLEMIENG